MDSTDSTLAPSTVAWWLATVVWAALIFHLSTPAFGADRSIPILAHLLTLFDLSVSHTTLDILDTFIRKLAHLTEYAIFALLLYRSSLGSRSLPAARCLLPAGSQPAASCPPGQSPLRGGAPLPAASRSQWRPHLAFCCVVIAALYSATDEYHQSFAPNRVPSTFDCLIDTTGAAVGMLIAYFSVRVSSRRTSLILQKQLNHGNVKSALAKT